MENLIEELNRHIKSSKNQYNLSDDYIDNLCFVYPFNKFEYVISHLLSCNCINIDEYYNIRDEYITRNKFLHLFEISAPRSFGETWAQNHLNELVQEFRRPTKSIDRSYSGEYDFWYNGVKIEVKASRAVNSSSNEPLYLKALDSASTLPYDMNFQQLKPQCCHIFIWVAVWRDKIKYWILPSKDVENSKYFSNQHRGGKGSDMSEGQIHITDKNIGDFSKYEVTPQNILTKIKTLSEK